MSLTCRVVLRPTRLRFCLVSFKENPAVLDVAAAGGEPALSMAKVCLTIIIAAGCDTPGKYRKLENTLILTFSHNAVTFCKQTPGDHGSLTL